MTVSEAQIEAGRNAVEKLMRANLGKRVTVEQQLEVIYLAMKAAEPLQQGDETFALHCTIYGLLLHRLDGSVERDTLKEIAHNIAALVRSPIEQSWRDPYSDPPPVGERVLTRMKHGLIEGTYDPEDKTFYGYYWRDMEWFADGWMPITAIGSQSIEGDTQ